MSNTVITNYTDLNGPSTKADSSVVVIVNKDGSLSVDQKLLGTLMGTDGTQGAISVVRVGHEGKPDDATDSETEDDKIPHVTLSVDSYYDEPNSIIKYDSGAEMLQSLRIETREKSLVGFHNDHCYTPLTSPSQILPQKSDSHAAYEEPVIEIVHNQLPHTPPPKPIPNSKKITILEQQILPKGKKIVLTPSESPVILKGNNALHKPLPVLTKAKAVRDSEKSEASQKTDENDDSSSMSSSGDSIPDRDSDSDYRDTKDRTVSGRVKKAKLKPRILKSAQPSKVTKSDIKLMPKFKSNKNILRREKGDKSLNKNILEKKDLEVDLESILPTSKIAVSSSTIDVTKNIVKLTPKPVKKEKKTPAHVTALLSDMSSLFSTPDVIRRVSTDTKIPSKPEKDPLPSDKKPQTPKLLEVSNDKLETAVKPADTTEKPKPVNPKTYLKSKAITSTEKTSKGFDLIPQIDDMSLAQILQDTTGMPTNAIKNQPSISTSTTMSSPGLAGPLSPTLDLLGGLQPEEEGLTEDLLMHVAQLVESSENLQEVIDKQVLGKVDSVPAKSHIQSPFQQVSSSLYSQTLSKSVKTIATPIRKDPIEIVRRDGRVITLPPIEAPATRSSKRKSQMETSQPEVLTPVMPRPTQVEDVIPEPLVPIVSKQYVNKKLTNKKPENVVQNVVEDKISAESQESWNSEDDPYRLWCICKQPHNNRFMICCDGCEDWFHGKCVNITKAMGQQMEEQGIEWRCPNCIKKAKLPSKTTPKMLLHSKKNENEEVVQGTLTPAVKDSASKTSCIVCKKPARASSIYCSDSCILKHAQDSLGNQSSSSKADTEPGKPQEKHKMESRVIVYERKSGRLLAGPNAPTAENLKAWLQKNPTFEVVRPGTLSTTKPNASKRKPSHEPNKIQTTLNFERIPKKITDQSTPTRTPPDVKERTIKVIPIPKEEPIPTPQPKTPVTPKSQHSLIFDTPKASTSSAKPVNEPRKIIRASASRSSTQDKAPAVSPSTSRRKDTPDSRSRMNSAEPIRDNVRKALQEQIANRMSEESGFKFSDEEIHQFAYDTEFELHELFRDVGMKYKAKYRSLMFNIKDRKNLSLWDKICSREITPKQLVRLSPEDLASQELAQWRDKEAKYQLELIKKSELDLLAASKTYVLKTHKGEEVMETKTSVQTELDPNVPVENLVKALNDSTVGEMVSNETTPESTQTKSDTLDKKNSGKKRDREDSSSNRSRKSKRNSKRDSESRKSRSSRRKSELKEKESKGEEQRRSTRRSEKKYSIEKSVSKGSKEKSDSSERSRHRSRSQTRTKRRSKSREYSRSASKGRERSRSRARSRRRSDSRETSKQRSRSKQPRTSTDDKHIARSRSQENVYTKNKNDSTDSDSIERPKSAMLKEAHPEYDPHEPMITSAFSEEDLRKSRDDMFDESYKNDIGEYNAEYDPAKSFSIDSSIILPSTTYVAKQDKASEPESDQEPTSTVDNSAATVWNGCINMVDVARFYVAAHEVSGSATDLEEDLSTELDIVGRINPDTVWEYISKMKKASNKDIVILKLQAANDEEKMQYIALYSYLSSRNRLGVVKVSSTTTVKDFYIVPLPANTALQEVLLPLDGPGLGESSHHLLIAIVIRLRKKRLPPNIPKDIIPAKVVRESRKRSYTPPIVSKSTNSPPASPKRRVPLPLPTYTSPALSTSVKDQIAASLACVDEDEAYSPGSSSSSASAGAGNPPAKSASAPASNTLRTKMDELNRQIEEQKQQILKMAQADSSVGEDEAYSPSRPMTPPTVGTLADIALPSNLQEILATIKQRTETSASSNTADVDMRNMPLP